MAKAEGMTLDFKSEGYILPELLETFEFHGEEVIHIETEEFSAVCPFSGLPDIAKVEIDYIPNGKCVELKSLKYFFLTFRQVGVYQERATEIIFEALRKALFGHLAYLDNGIIKVTTTYNIRGGFKTIVTCGDINK